MTHTQAETFILACMLDHPKATYGPWVCTFMADAYRGLMSPEAAKVATALKECVWLRRPVSAYNVASLMEPEYRPWLRHPDFSHDRALSMDIAEYEAETCVRYYSREINKVPCPGCGKELWITNIS